MLRRFSISILIWILITQFALANQYQTVNQTESVKQPEIHQLTRDVLQTIEPPLLTMLKESRQMPPVDLDFSKQLSLLDEDPFFMASQQWMESNEEDKTFKIVDNELFLKFAETKNRMLNIQLPLVPVGMSDDYIFLNATSAEFFKAKFADDMESYSEGLFIVERADLVRNSMINHPVPVFYFPLPEGNWTGDRPAIYQPAFDAVTITAHDGDAISIEQKDIKELIKVQKLNLLLAQGEGWKDAVTNIDQPGKLSHVIPAPGTTAGFGTLFVGNQNMDFKQGSWFDSLISRVIASSDEAMGKEDERMRKQLTRVSVILGIGIVLGITLKYTIYKEHFATRRATQPTSAVKKLSGEMKEVLDVYAHILTTVAQFCGITFGNISEFMLDRYLPGIAAGENKMIRKFMKRTILFTRNAATRVPVNANTWFLGSIVLGGIDTLFVFVQLYNVVPEISRSIAEAFPILESRVDGAFGVDNPNIANINRNEVIRNLFAYMTAGAASYSAEVKVQLSQVVGDEIDKLLLKQGKDPSDPVNVALKNRMLEEKLEILMKQYGLPSKDEFLFDFSTIYAQGMKMIGYDLPAEGSEGRLMVADRPGLLIPSLQKAVEEAQRQYQMHRYQADVNIYKQTLQILEDTSKQVSFMRQWLLRPLKSIFTSKETFWNAMKEGMKTIKEMRKNLTLLTYEGNSSIKLDLLPASWLQGYDSQAALYASQIYRQAFNEYISGQEKPKSYIKMDYVRNASIERIDQAKEIALEQVANALGVTKNKALQDKYPTLYFHHYYNAHQLLHEEEKLQSQKYRPERVDFLGWWQKKRALGKTDKSFIKKYNSAFDPQIATVEQQKFWHQQYLVNLMNNVGLYPDFSDYPELDEEVYQTAEKMSEELFKRESVQKYVEGLPLKKQAEFKAYIASTNAVSVYIDKIVGRDDVNALSSTQPGRWQKLRQTKFFKKDSFFSKAATRVVRFFEALGPDTEYRLGITSWIYRNIPLVFDFTKGFQRSMYTAPTSILATWGFNQIFWGADISMSMWVFFLGLGFTIRGPSMTINRLFHHQSLKPMGSWKMMAAMGMVYTWATFWGSVPMQIFAADFQKLWDSTGMLLYRALELGIIPMIDACSKALGG